MPPGDVLCICGDISPLYIQRSTQKCIAWFAGAFLPWTDSLPYKRVIFIGGNHDFFLEDLHNGGIEKIGCQYNAREVENILMPEGLGKKHKVTYLFDSSSTIDNKTFYGTPWIAELDRWAFYKDDDELRNIYDKIPSGVDVLMTHMPPKVNDIGRVLQGGVFNTGSDFGSQDLADVINSKNIKYSISGHVHSGNHQFEDTGSGCLAANCSIKNENYEMTYYPLEFEI